MKYKGCIVVQGKTNLEALPKIKKCFEGYQLIHSCWEGDDMRFYDSSDIIIKNEIPSYAGPGNFYLQRKSTIEGMKMALDLGWNRALKWRSDMWCTNADELMKLFHNDSLNLYFWIRHLDGYITDFFMEGEIGDIITLFDTDLPQHKWNYPEFGITLQFFRNGFDKKGRFMGRGLGEGCDIFWEKNRCWMSQNKTDDWYQDSLPDNWKNWIPTRKGKPINLFE